MDEYSDSFGIWIIAVTIIFTIYNLNKCCSSYIARRIILGGNPGLRFLTDSLVRKNVELDPKKAFNFQVLAGEASSQSSYEMVVEQVRSNGERPPPLPYQNPRSELNQSVTIKAHPNSLKNIKNFPILMASETKNRPIEDDHVILFYHNYVLSYVNS